jgi:hypothetical protein
MLDHPDAGEIKDGLSGGSGIFESKLPSVVFATFFLPYETEDYKGFYPYIAPTTQITLRMSVQIEFFNRYMVR